MKKQLRNLIIGIVTAICIILLMIYVTSPSFSNNFEVKIINSFFQEIDGTIEITSSDYSTTRKINIWYDTTESYWFNIPNFSPDKEYQVTFTATYGTDNPISDSATHLTSDGERAGSIEFRIDGTYPTIRVKVMGHT